MFGSLNCSSLSSFPCHVFIVDGILRSVLGSGFDADLIPIVNRLAEVLDRADVDVAKLNSLDDVAASEKLEITAFPTFVL